MQKEIPNPSEKKSKADRLRAASRNLQELPLEKHPSIEEWDQAAGELTQDEIEHLHKLARGHLERALEAVASGDPLDAADEAKAAVLLGPRETVWARSVKAELQAAGWKGMEAEAFYVLVDRRSGKKTRKRPGWLIPVLVLAISAPIGIALVLFLGSGLLLGHPVSRVQGPRTMEAVFDTQGVKTNIQVAQSRMVIFPEATVAELSAWVTFPDHRVDVWEGSVKVLDPQGATLASRDVVFHASSQGPLEAGQGLAVFQQFDAWPFFDRVSSFQLTTTRILAKEAKPAQRTEMPVEGVGDLTAGYGLKVWVQDSRWTERFASRVQTLALEIENTGLKPFAELQFDLVWRNNSGKTLKTITLRPVSAFRTALPSGAKLGMTQETVFDTEVFSWPAGEEPHPTLELTQWQ